MNMFNLFNLFTSTAHSRSHLTLTQCVRWKRRPKKPSWLGIAKTKMFKIPVKKELPEVEKAELDRIKYIYERQLISLKQFMITDESNKITNVDNFKIIQENKEQCKILIENWNAKSALLREERLEKEKIEQEEAALEKVFKETEKKKNIEAKVDEIVIAEIAAGSTFVTKENLDKVLDDCLNNIQDYNYALDLKGNIYKGESTIPVGTLNPSNVNEMISDFKIPDSKDRQSQKEIIK